jgi:signal transduction histidine kinase/CheY-like chemotaxis protein
MMTMRALREMPDKSPGRPLPQSGARRLTILYIGALSAVALLSLAGQAVVQLHLDSQMSDSRVVNIAGRQRMLSQRIAKAALAADAATDPKQIAAARSELSDTLVLWERSHRGLQEGDPELGLPGKSSAEVQRLFAALEPSFRGMLAPAQRLADANLTEDSTPQRAADIAELLRHEQDFLTGMDAIVTQYAAEASQKVAQVKGIERGLLLVTLAVLVLEALFVFRPAVRRIRAMIAALEATGVKLAAARDAAESANDAKSRFLAVTSHELRTPLHAVLGIAEQLEKTPLNDSQRHGIVVLRDSAKTQLALVNDLLDLARIDSGKLELRMQAVPLRPLLNQSLEFVRLDAAKKGLELSADVDGDLPVAIVTDSLRLGQVLLNLLGNAVKFTDRGTVRLEVKQFPQTRGLAKLRFTVRDTGIGIPIAEQRRIFENFTQIDGSLARSQGGVGLGLAISRRLVALLGGKLELESEIGRGSRFSFTLVCEVANASTQRHTSEHKYRESAAAKCHQSASGGPILVVDDAAANRHLAATILRGAGYAVVVAASGDEALQAIAANSFLAILLDIHMPGMDGVEVARAVRHYEAEHNFGRTPIIGLTADAMPETSARLCSNSIDVVLHKPASEEAMLAAIASATVQRQCTAERTVTASEQSTNMCTGRPLARLRGDRALLAELAKLFPAEASQQRARIEDGLRSADASAVRKAAHCLRGQALLFDAAELCAALSEVEEHAATGQLQYCGMSWKTAAKQLDSLCETLARD